MIPRRHAWLIRDVASAFDADFGYGHTCRICSVTDRGAVSVRPADRERHLAGHRAEKIVYDTPAAAAAPTRED